MARYLYSELAGLLTARNTVLKRYQAGKDLAFDKHSHIERLVSDLAFDKHSHIERLVSEHMPSGSGFDSGTELDFDASHSDKLVFRTSYHHMDNGGSYDGWTEHVVTVTPSLVHRLHVRVSGRNRNDIKEYIAQTFIDALETDVTPKLV